jgi:hypothetical protein
MGGPPPIPVQAALLYARPQAWASDPLAAIRRWERDVLAGQQAALVRDGWVVGWAAWWRVASDVLARLRFLDLEAVVERLSVPARCHGPHVYVHAWTLAPWAPPIAGPRLSHLVRERNRDAVSIGWHRECNGVPHWRHWRFA